MSGRFLISLRTSCSLDAERRVSLALDQSTRERHTLPYNESGAFQTASQLSIELRTVSSSTIFAAIPILSRTTAQIIPLAVETRPRDGWKALEDVLKRLNFMASTVDLHWSLSPLSLVDSEDSIGKLGPTPINLA